MTRLKHIAEGEISLEGRWAAAVVHSFLPERNTVTRQVFVVGVDDGSVRQVSPEEAKDAGLSWAPDSQRLAFFRARGKAEVLCIYDLASGECHDVLDDVPG